MNRDLAAKVSALIEEHGAAEYERGCRDGAASLERVRAWFAGDANKRVSREVFLEWFDAEIRSFRLRFEDANGRPGRKP